MDTRVPANHAVHSFILILFMSELQFPGPLQWWI